MRALIFLFWLLSMIKAYSQQISIVQVNAEWNIRNSIDLNGIRGASIKFAYLSEQPEALKSRIKSVPTVWVFKDGQMVKYWEADVTLKLRVRREDIQEYIDSIKD
jgi:hypothetical protein